MLLQKILLWFTIQIILFIPLVSASPMSANLSRDLARQIIADNLNHASATSREVVQSSSLKTELADASHQTAQFSALRQATLIVRKMVQQAPTRTPETIPVVESSAVAVQQKAVNTEQLVAEVKSEVDARIDTVEPTATTGFDFSTLLAANDFNESLQYQSYEGMAFGDTRHRVRNGFWTNFKTFSAKRQNTDTMSGFEASGKLFMGGLEMDNLMPGALFGTAIIMSTNRIDDIPDQKRNDIHSFTGSLYSSWKFDTAFLETSVAFGRARNKTRRMATVGSDTGHLESEYYTSTTHARLLAGNTYNLSPDWMLAPQVELNYNRVSFGSYTEKWDRDCTGTCTDPVVRYRPDAQSSMDGGLGFSLAGNLVYGRARFEPFVNIMGYHNFRRDTSSQKSVYVTGIDQVVMTAPERSRSRARLSFGLSLTLDPGFRMDLGVIRNQMKGYKDDSVSLKIRYRF